jgi:diguanylate cyclase (GGDEF)-like protein/PAS domain S-box-containing protein
MTSRMMGNESTETPAKDVPIGGRPTSGKGSTEKIRPQELIQRLLAKKYGPACVLADRDGQILQYHGRTALYLDIPPGEPTQNVLAMVRDGFRQKLRNAMKQVITERRSLTIQALIHREERYVAVRTSIDFVESPEYTQPLVLISFEDEMPLWTSAAALSDQEPLVQQLESELKGTREELEGTIETLRSALSVNERQLDLLNDDFTNLINSTDIAALSLDLDLQIQWFTPAVSAVLDLHAGGVNQSIAGVLQRVPDVDLVVDSQNVLHSLKPVKKQLPQKDGRSWIRQVFPYLTKDRLTKGVVITYIDVTQLRLAEETQRRLNIVLADSSDAIVVFDLAGQITAWNRAAERIYGYTEPEALKLNVAHLIPEGLRNTERQILETGRKTLVIPPREITRVCKDGTLRSVLATTTILTNDEGVATYVSTTERDLSESKAVGRIQHLATHDQLTGLPNRLLLDDLASQALAYARRADTKVAVLFVDIDHFKIVNDSRGHQVGDIVLNQIARRLRDCVRGQDSVVRHGVDEFIVMLTGIHEAAAVGQVAEHILASVARPCKVRDEEIQSTVSIGISIYPDDASNLERLVRNADAAMYRAKGRGPGKYSYFTSGMSSGVWDAQSVEYGLFRALDRHEFIIEYQPQIEIATGRIFGGEALLRWQHPDLGLLKPINFISAAEDTGLIVALGEWVMKTACAQVRAWQAAGFPDIQVAVNLSAVQVQQLDFPATIARVLAETQLDPKYLELEITESALMRNVDASIARLHHLRQMGVNLALDDFGTGYSSLSYLRQMPINRLKMDFSFVHALARDPGGDVLVKAILNIAKSLHLEVLAEGVETIEQLELLRAEGCDQAQGYYFSSPVSASEFEELLRQGRILPGLPKARVVGSQLGESG